MRSDTAWRAWFDGSAVPNPGCIGIGAVLLSPEGERLEISFSAGNGDNTRAEYLALIALLELAIEHGVQHLIVQGDSRVVLNDIDATAPIRTGEQEACRRQALHLMAHIPALQLQWIPRARNGDADRLARMPVGLPAAKISK